MNTKEMILAIFNNRKMDAPDDVLVFAIEDVPVVIEEILDSFVVKGDEYPYEYTEEDLEQLKKDGWVKIRNNGGLSEESAKYKIHLLLDGWLITPCGKKYPLKRYTTDIREVTCRKCISLVKDKEDEKQN